MHSTTVCPFTRQYTVHNSNLAKDTGSFKSDVSMVVRGKMCSTRNEEGASSLQDHADFHKNPNCPSKSGAELPVSAFPKVEKAPSCKGGKDIQWVLGPPRNY